MELLWIVIALVVGIVIGYAAARYVGRKWPDADFALDVVAEKFGDRADIAVKRARTKLGDKVRGDGA